MADLRLETGMDVFKASALLEGFYYDSPTAEQIKQAKQFLDRQTWKHYTSHKTAQEEDSDLKSTTALQY